MIDIATDMVLWRPNYQLLFKLIMKIEILEIDLISNINMRNAMDCTVTADA